MATPTLSLATMGSSRKKHPNKSVQNDDKSKGSIEKSSSPKLVLSNSDKKLRKFWGQEVNEDSIYSIYLKKITYSFNCDDIITKLKFDEDSELVTRCDQTDSSNHKKSPRRTTTWYDNEQVRYLILILILFSKYFLWSVLSN